MARASFPEHLMHRVWREHQEYLIEHPVLSDGTVLVVHDPGIHNDHRGGPDFLGAKIELAGMLISGDIELHQSLKDWREHGHSEDSRYANVILHVVLHADEAYGVPHLPVLALSENLALDRRSIWFNLFEEIYRHAPELPCFPHNLRVPMRFKRKVIERFGHSRLDDLVARFDLSQGWDVFVQHLYEQTLDALGYSENRTPFREIARIVSVEKLRAAFRMSKADNRSIVFESLFFGVGGLLTGPSAAFSSAANEHLIELAANWEWLRDALDLTEPLTLEDWAFFRIRPLNSPYRRLALAAKIAERVFSRREIGAAESFLDQGIDVGVGANPFWEDRTSFESELSKAESLLGAERANAMMLNVLLPARIALLKQAGGFSGERIQALRKEWGASHSESSARYLNIIRQELLESERVNTVLFEQGALKLARSFCFEGRCDACPIGRLLIEKSWKPPRSGSR